MRGAGGVVPAESRLKSALDKAGTSTEVTQAALDANADARIDGLRAALAILAFTALLAMFFTSRIPEAQPRSAESWSQDGRNKPSLLPRPEGRGKAHSAHKGRARARGLHRQGPRRAVQDHGPG